MKSALLIGHLSDDGNTGTLIRTAEAMGINTIFSIGKKRKYKTAKGADKHVNFFELDSIGQFIEFCNKNNYSIVAIEDLENSIPLSKVKKYPVNPVFVTGHESMGIPKEILDNAKMIVKIEQAHTYVRCLNTAVAGSIIMNDFFKYIQQRDKSGRLK